LRGDKLGKVDFRQILERVERVQIRYDRVIAELKRLNSERSVAGAVYAAVAAVIVLMMLKRCAGCIVRGGGLLCRACCMSRGL